MAALQREFQIFREGRPFVASAALLDVGGLAYDPARNRWLANDPAKDRWFELLSELPTYRSDRSPAENGDQRIVNALIANFGKAEPSPCFMRGHDGREPDASRVIVLENHTPLFYFDRTQYLTISLPMRPPEQPRARRARQ
jgi:hypothetical protein